jgi:hypothetical protein
VVAGRVSTPELEALLADQRSRTMLVVLSDPDHSEPLLGLRDTWVFDALADGERLRERTVGEAGSWLAMYTRRTARSHRLMILQIAMGGSD